jgi:threonine 3-dehydrogenase
MKAIIKQEEKRGFSLLEIEAPEPGPGEVQVKVDSAAICGSDLKLYKWTDWCKTIVKSLPFIPGHEGAGEITALGDGVKGFSVGDRVAAETHIPCGSCWQCRNNRPHTCLNMELFGHTVNGCFAEYFSIHSSAVWKLADGFPLDKGCLLEPMGIPLRAVYGDDIAGETVAVIGCGPIGQFAVGTAAVRGAGAIIAIDVNENRLSIAREMGATHFINPERDGVTESVLAITGENGAGVVIEASGSGTALGTALEYIRIGGTIYTIGHPVEPVSIDISARIILREIRLVGLFGRELWKTWEIGQELIESGKLDPGPIVTHIYPLEEFEEAFHMAESGKGCKIVLRP